jgi:hypothetical protein
MRPHGNARKALVDSLQAHGRGALADLVARTGLEYRKVRQVLADCVRAGAFTYKLERRPHARRPVAVYEIASGPAVPPDRDAWLPLATAWRT